MGAGCSSSSSSSSFSLSLSSPNYHYSPSSTLHPKSPSNFIISPSNHIFYSQFLKSSTNSPPKCRSSSIHEIKTNKSTNPLKTAMSNPHTELLQKLVHDALVWSSLYGLVVGDRSVERSGSVPGVGMVHAPIALLPNSFPEVQWNQACELAPVFNELVDLVSLDGNMEKLPWYLDEFLDHVSDDGDDDDDDDKNIENNVS
ncbi:hypothetical protein L1987_37199 [Smallanthus sonchifolius]|nr:hypothetical protein L1987_37199 [Smallanthus sonchifolius]